MLERSNNIWRRRKCQTCLSVFTTREQPELGAAFMTVAHDGSLRPFSRDRLFIAVYESCKHRSSATDDASALTQTVIAILLGRKNQGAIPTADITAIAAKTLGRFDPVAAAVYMAYHPAVA